MWEQSAKTDRRRAESWRKRMPTRMACSIAHLEATALANEACAAGLRYTLANHDAGALARECAALRRALHAIAREALSNGEHNPVSGKILLPQGYQAIHRIAESALQNNKVSESAESGDRRQN